MKNREMKFKIFDKVHNKMIGIFTLKELSQSDILIDFGERNLVIFQYIGRKDKKEKEIYEGDIYEYEVSAQIFKGGKGKYKGIVEWDEDHPEGGLIGTYIGFYLDKRPEDIEIIGNIFKNPELINGQLH